GAAGAGAGSSCFFAQPTTSDATTSVRTIIAANYARSAARNLRRFRDGGSEVGWHALPALRRRARIIFVPRAVLALVDPDQRARGLVAAVLQPRSRDRPLARRHRHDGDAARIDRLAAECLRADRADDELCDLGPAIIVGRRLGARSV